MQLQRRVGLVLVGVAVAGYAAFAQDLQPARDLQLLSYLPKDPVAAWAADVGNGGEVFDAVVGFVRKVVPDAERAELEKGLADLDAKLGLSLRNDLLVELGPEMAFALDVPPIDAAAGAVMANAPGSMATVLGKLGLWVQVHDRAKVDRALRTLADRAGLLASEEQGLVRLRLPEEKSQTGGSSGPDVNLFYAIDGGILAVGFEPDRVRAMTGAAKAEERLAAGADFQRVLSHLDRGARSVLYVNLPRVQELLRGSQMVQGALNANAEAQPVAQLLLDPTLAATGYGATTVLVDGGTRQVSFGPSWTAGGAATLGVVSAIAVPNFTNAVSRGRQKRTMADIRTLATALEAYSVDNNRYPASQGWVDAGTLSGELSPLYVNSLPMTDGWAHPLRYWSDGMHYRIVSPGKDGQTSQDWSGEVEPQTTTSFDADIVYGDGSFLVSPQ